MALSGCRQIIPTRKPPEMPEIRAEIPATELAVIDGYCSATGKNRTEIILGLIRDWSNQKLHESIMVCRVAGVNPTSPEGAGVEGHCNRPGTAVSVKADRGDRG